MGAAEITGNFFFSVPSFILSYDDFVCMAAYGDLEMGYIGTGSAYTQSGYEMEESSSYVGPNVESVLMNTMKQAMNVE